MAGEGGKGEGGMPDGARGPNDRPITMSIGRKVIRRDSASSPRLRAPINAPPRFIVLFFSAIRADTDTHLPGVAYPPRSLPAISTSGGRGMQTVAWKQATTEHS